MDDHERECLSCGWPAPAGAGACLHCLTPRPGEADDGIDVLGGLALTAARLRRFVQGGPDRSDQC